MSGTESKAVELLLVEDDEDFKAAMTSRLSKRGFVVTATAAAEDALELIDRREFDVVVSDIRLPGISGTEFLAKVREMHTELPVILVTGYASLDSAREAVALNASDYLMKPLVRIEELLLPIDRAVRSYRLIRENRALLTSLQSKTADLAASERRYRDLFEYYETIVSSMPDAVLILSDRLRVQVANHVFCRMFGKEEHEVIDTHVGEVFGESFLQKFECLTGADVDIDRPARFEWATVDGTGSPVCTEVSLKRMQLEHRDRILMIISDVTDLRRAEEEKKGMESHFIEMQKMEAVGQLAGGIAHDVKNSLTPIIGSAELIQEAVRDTDGRLVEYADVIIRCAGRANELTRQLLTFARRGRYEETVFDFHAVLGEAVRFLEHTVPKDVCIRTVMDAENTVMRGDPTQIHQMLLNLALNARDAMPEGGTLFFSTSTIELDPLFCEREPGVRPGEHLELVVSDTGCGMSEEVLERAFEPFFTTKRVGEGTGLGLSSVYGFVRMHNGCISVKSAEGTGTTFTIHFPMASVPETLNGWDEATRAVHTGRGTILVVDDEEEVRRILRAQLERFGYDVRECADGKEALEFYRRHGTDVDAVILDIMMPNSSGVECFSRLKMIDPDVKVLLMSGYAVDAACRTLLDSGARGFMEKPFGEAEVSRKLAEVLNG